MEKHKRARVKALAKIAKQLHSGVNYSAPFQCQTSGELKDMRAITQYISASCSPDYEQKLYTNENYYIKELIRRLPSITIW